MPRFSHERLDYKEMLTISSEPEVKNGLVLPEHAEYANAWQRIINPKNENLSLLYGCIGADLAIALRTTGATQIYGIEAMPIDFRVLQRCLSQWDIIDTNKFKFPAKTKYWLECDVEGELLPNLSTDALFNFFKESIDRKQECGYWDERYLDGLSIERLIFVELKKMGVDPNSISINRDDDGIHLAFQWKNKKREILYIKANTADLHKPYVRNKVPDVDIAMVKAGLAINTFLKKQGNRLIDSLDNYLKKDGIILIGATIGTDQEVRESEENFLQDTNSRGYTTLKVPDDPIRKMEEKTAHLDNIKHYGWKLCGVQKPKNRK